MQLLLGPDAIESYGIGGGSTTPSTLAVEPGESSSVGGGNAADAYNAPGASSPDPGGASGQAPAPADPNQRAGATLPAAPQQAQWQSIRDAAQAAGFQFGADVTDDRQALNFLLQRAQASRQQNVYEQLGRQLAPKSEQILGYLRQQGGQGVPLPGNPQRPAWEAPEFDERWAACVDRDPGTGLFVAKQGFPPEIAQKVNEYVQWKQNFDRNPAGVLNQMVEAKAEERARAVFQEQYGAVQRDSVIQSIVAENNQWMYQLDAQGNPLRNFDGQQVVTPVGARYVHHLRQVVSAGVRDPRQQDQLAKQLVRGEYAQQYYSSQAAQAGQAADPQFQQAQGRQNVNPLQAQSIDQRRRNPAATEPDQAGLTLADRLRLDFAASGVSETDIFNSASS